MFKTVGMFWKMLILIKTIGRELLYVFYPYAADG